MKVSLPSEDDPSISSIIQKQNYLQGDGWYLLQDNWLYGLTWRDDGSGYFAKRRTDGSDYTKLLDVPVKDVAIDNGYIYGANLYRCGLDGSNIEEIISRRVFCWYVFGELVLYQDDIEKVDYDCGSCYCYNPWDDWSTDA